MTKQLDELMSGHEKLQGAQKLLGAVRSGLDELVDMGLEVSQDAVVKTAGKLVAAGLSPKEMAGMLSEMPEEPEKINQWLAGIEQDVAQREKQLVQAQATVRQKMGVEALNQLFADSKSQGAAPQAPANAMMLGAGGSNA